jgi:hypothetical protein
MEDLYLTDNSHTATTATNKTLGGADDFQPWKQSSLRYLSARDLDKFTEFDLSTLQATVTERYAAGGDSLSFELKLRRDDQLDKLALKHKQASTYLLNSLSSSILDRVPANLSDPRKPQTKQLWEWFELQYGAASPSRMAELFRDACEMKTEENVDPGINLARMKKIVENITAAASGMTLESFLAAMKVFFMLKTLPYSFQPTVERLLPVAGVAPDPQTIINTVDNVWRVREREGMEVHKGLVARAEEKKPETRGRERALGPDGKAVLGGDPQAYCTRHECFGHTVQNCRMKAKEDRSQGAWRKGDVKKKKAMVAEKGGKEKAVIVLDAASDGDSDLSCDLAALGSIGPTALAASSVQSTLIVDSGANEHFVKEKSLLTNYRLLPQPRPVQIADGKYIEAIAKGDIRIGRLLIVGAHHVPAMAHNLLSVKRILKNKGWRYNFLGDTAELVGPDGVVHVKAKAIGPELYTVRIAKPLSVSRADKALISWHYRCGHLNTAGVKRLGKDGRLGKGWEKELGDEEACIECLAGKARRKRTGLGTTRATRPFEVISIDLWGPASTIARDGSRYILTSYDDFSHRITTTFLAHKSDASKAVQNLIAWGEKQQEGVVKQVRSDAGGEFLAKSLKDWFAHKGISHVVIPPTDHSQNGRVERAHLTILNDVRTLLASSGLPLSFWAEAARYSAYTRNRTLRVGSDMSPEDIWRGQKVDLKHLLAFGQGAVYRITEHQSKIIPRGRRAVIVGYDDDASFYRLYDPVLRRVVKSRDVDPLDSIGLLIPPSAPPIPLAEPEAPVILEEEDDEDEDDEWGPGEVDAIPPQQEEALGIQPRDARHWQYIVEPRPPPGFQERPVDVVQLNDPAVRYPTRHARAQEMAAGPARHGLLALIAASAVQNVPKTYRQACESAEAELWNKAIGAELGNMEKYQVWVAIPRKDMPKGRRSHWQMGLHQKDRRHIRCTHKTQSSLRRSRFPTSLRKRLLGHMGLSRP